MTICKLGYVSTDVFKFKNIFINSFNDNNVVLKNIVQFIWTVSKLIFKT